MTEQEQINALKVLVQFLFTRTTDKHISEAEVMFVKSRAKMLGLDISFRDYE